MSIWIESKNFIMYRANITQDDIEAAQAIRFFAGCAAATVLGESPNKIDHVLSDLQAIKMNADNIIGQK